MTTLSRFDSRRAARLLARSTTLAAAVAVVLSLILVATTGSIEVALFSVFAAVGGGYAGKVGWRGN